MQCCSWAAQDLTASRLGARGSTLLASFRGLPGGLPTLLDWVPGGPGYRLHSTGPSRCCELGGGDRGGGIEQGVRWEEGQGQGVEGEGEGYDSFKIGAQEVQHCWLHLAGCLAVCLPYSIGYLEGQDTGGIRLDHHAAVSWREGGGCRGWVGGQGR